MLHMPKPPDSDGFLSVTVPMRPSISEHTPRAHPGHTQHVLARRDIPSHGLTPFLAIISPTDNPIAISNNLTGLHKQDQGKVLR